ncbi:MAG: DsrE family protein, partial [Woeseiaceae bacterium]
MKNAFRLAVVATMAIATSGAVMAQDKLPIQGYPATREVPDAKLLPDPNVVHKVVFDAVNAAENVDDVNPMLVAVARYVNTLA